MRLLKICEVYVCFDEYCRMSLDVMKVMVFWVLKWYVFVRDFLDYSRWLFLVKIGKWMLICVGLVNFFKN